LESLNDKAPAAEPRGGWRAEIDEEGRMVLPAEFRRLYGLNPGAKIRLEETMIGVRMRHPVTHLAKVYIEPTNCCNLECRTCIRNAWDEPMGRMSPKTFKRILKGLKEFSPVPSVFFGGFGEPLSHPDIISMINQAKNLGSRV